MRIKIFKTSAAQSLGKTTAAFGSGNAATIERGLDHRTYRRAGLEPRILLHTGKARSLAKRHFPAVGIDFARKNSEKRGFTGAVRTDQADAVSVRNGERDVLKERIRPKRFRNFLRVDDGRRCRRQ